MVTITVPRSATTASTARHELSNPLFQAFVVLRIGFTVAPILFGLEKFLNWLVDWRVYLAPEIDGLIPALTLARLATAFDRSSTTALSQS